ncbi:hypothetical protein B566_EDAN009779 [Ephemera danica]|nr:hypothetical protein B566_EDAN009779 [Ephemera danica]
MTLNSVHRGMDPHIRSGSKAVEILLDVLPMMMYIIMPCLKNANAQLFTVHEKMELNRVVNIFIEFGLVYVQERTADGDMIFRMEPPARASPKQQTAKQNLPNHLQSLSPQILKPQKLRPVSTFSFRFEGINTA